MLKIILSDKLEHEVLSNTAVYPSYNSNQRSKMEIHIALEKMSTERLEEIFCNKALTSEIRLINTENDNETTYFDYSIIAGIGKKRVDMVDYTTGNVSEALELVVELEQLTFIEKKLAELGVL